MENELSNLMNSYIQYCQTRFSKPCALELVAELKNTGLVLESECLLAFSQQDTEINKLKQLDITPWEGKSIWLSKAPPSCAISGDWWFDPIQICFYARMFREPMDEFDRPVNGWCAVKPVQVWQFRAFLKMVRFRPYGYTPQGLAVPSKLLEDRYQSQKETAFITHVTDYMGVLYSAWYGKGGLSNLHDVTRSFSHGQVRDLFKHRLFLLAGRHYGAEQDSLVTQIDTKEVFELHNDKWSHHFKMLENFTKDKPINKWEVFPNTTFQSYINEKRNLRYVTSFPQEIAGCGELLNSIVAL